MCSSDLGRITGILKALNDALVKKFGVSSQPTELTIDDDHGHGVWQHIAQKLGMAYGAQRVAEGTEQNSDKIRNQLNSLMDQDQQYTDPTQRIAFQNKVWPYIQKNIKTILADKGEKGNGDYPAAPYAAWLLVQHMDANPQHQIEFYNQLKKAIPNHPKIQFLRDRAAVNQWILKNADDPRYFHNGRALPNPTVNVRNPAIFSDAGVVAASRQEALQNARDAGNKLLVAAVRATRAQTQPSYRQGVAESRNINESAVFLNPNAVIVGQDHGKSLNLSPETLKRVQAIAARHGAW